MTLTRRLVLVSLAMLLGSGVLGIAPAQASFGNSAAVPSMRMTTTAVAAPGRFKGSLTCGSTSATMAASWTLSGTPQVSGYLVTVSFSDGYTQTVPLSSTATGWSAAIGIYNVTAYQVQYSVTTQTSYGWTQESARTAWFHC